MWLDERPDEDTTGSLAVGELGGLVERARAAASFAAELDRRHEERLENERSFADSFETALDRCLESIDAADMPDESTEPADLVEADVVDTIGERVVLDAAAAFVNAAERTTEPASNGETAMALQRALKFEQNRRAYETIRNRIEDGAHRTVEAVDDVRAVRESALKAANDAPFSPDEPSLAGDVLAREYERLGRIDARIRRTIDDDRENDLSRRYSASSEYSDYVVIGTQLEVLPETVAVFEARLEG